MDTNTIIEGIMVAIAIGSAIYAAKQAKAAREQADAAKESIKILQTESKRKIIDCCIVFYKQHGEWQTYLDSLPDLSKEEREEIDKKVRTRLGKKK